MMRFNPTQLTGLLAFALAALACARTAMRRDRSRASIWWGIAAVQAACFAEVLIGLRHRSHDLVDALLQADGLYASRSGLQVGLVVSASLIGFGIVVTIARWRHLEPRASGAMMGCALALGLFVVETISLHAVDRVMYQLVGPVMLVGWLWAATAFWVAVMAWQAARHEHVKRESGRAPHR